MRTTEVRRFLVRCSCLRHAGRGKRRGSARQTLGATSYCAHCLRTGAKDGITPSELRTRRNEEAAGNDCSAPGGRSPAAAVVDDMDEEEDSSAVAARTAIPSAADLSTMDYKKLKELYCLTFKSLTTSNKKQWCGSMCPDDTWKCGKLHQRPPGFAGCSVGSGTISGTRRSAVVVVVRSSGHHAQRGRRQQTDLGRFNFLSLMLAGIAGRLARSAKRACTRILRSFAPIAGL